MWNKSAIHMYSIFILQILQPELGFSQGTSNTFVDVFLGKCAAVRLLTLDGLQSAATPATTRSFEGVLGSAMPAASADCTWGCSVPCARCQRKAVAKDRHACLQDGHFYVRFVGRKQRHYCAAGVVTQLQPGVVFTQ